MSESFLKECVCMLCEAPWRALCESETTRKDFHPRRGVEPRILAKRRIRQEARADK